MWAFHSGGFSRSTVSRASAVAAEFSHCGAWACSTACENFLAQGLNPCPLYWQTVSYPLYHYGSSPFILLIEMFIDTIEDSLQKQEKYNVHAIHSVSPNNNIYKMII